MTKKIISFLLVSILVIANLSITNAGPERQDDYNQLKSINIGTFNEYGYKITEQFFKLKQNFQVNSIIDVNVLKNIDTLAVTGYKYLPDSLTNKNYLNDLQSAIQKGYKYKTSEGVYTEIVKAIEKYLYNTEINKITGTIEVSPDNGNAPLNVTLRARVTDPTGTVIPKDNYIWWIDSAGTRKIVGRGPSMNYTLNDEGKFSIFLDVLSNHRNALKYIDVLPFSSRADITVKQKVANLLIRVNDKELRNEDVLKFSPDEASYGIIFDATSSTSTSGTKFLKTTWDFGNGVKKEYDGGPKVERVIFGTEGDYIVRLTLKTNELQLVERKFTISVHKPVAAIVTSQDQGFIGDKFTFSANPSVFEKNLTYNWEIVDIDRNETILQKAGNLFTYEFSNKGKFNVKLKVTDPSGDVDNDNRIIYINSRAPVAEFAYSVPKPNKPNRVLLDATKSYDQDYTDDGKLEFSWEIDGQKVDLEDPNYNGSLGYYTFDSIGDHSVVLDVTDPDGIKSQKKDKVKVNSILSVDYSAYPVVITRNSFIKFLATSSEAKFFKWDFGDGNIDGGSNDKINHTFNKSGTFDVKLEVSDSEGNTNSITKKVYVADTDYPYALIDVQYENGFDVPYNSSGCDGKGAYTIDRVSNIKFNGQNSINVDGQNSGLTYSWKIGVDKFSSSSSFTQKFDEMGCFPVKLTVRSDKNKKTHTQETYVEVKNIKPTLSSLNIQAIDINADPVIVNVSAIGATDRDGVILSYLWYYYTDSDSEPQDFRITVNPNTTFVLPKISGSYYFVVVLKDNNEEKFSSEDLGNKTYLPLTGDNVNTPILDLSVNDSSVSVEDDVVFNVKVRNVIGQDLTDKAVYSWDFDGDGFYDKEVTGKGTMTYKFEKAGTYHVKVKAKYKGISNVKTVTVDVVNNLTPDFDYISILNKIIFFNKSSGKYDNITWDLGDGTIKDGTDNLVYTYTDGKDSHDVTLKISDGTKLKEIKKTVEKNIKNLVKANKTGLNIFSSPEIDSSGSIVLAKPNEKVFLYLGASKGDYKNYVIDYDTNYDSDLNGGKDDDIDNKDTPSYTTGDPVEIKLNENRNQNVRVILKDSAGKIAEQQDIQIIKEYIKQEEKSIDDIVFTGVTDAEKQKIELLKNYVNELPQDYRVAGMSYLERLQGEWFDETEKTKVIVEFEGFLDNPDITNSTEIINLLESILVEGQADKSQKSVSFNALKNLLRDDITCTFDSNAYATCKEYLISVLESIRDATDIEKAKESSKIVLQAVLDDKVMTDKEKLDFKEILKGLIYNGTDILNTETQTTQTTQSTSLWSKIIGFFTGAAWIIFLIIAIVGAIIIGYWVYFKFSNKDKSKGFEEFIIEKTSSGDDILGGINESTGNVTEEKIDSKKDIDFTFGEENTEKQTVPDWLKSTFTQNTDESKSLPTDIKTEEVIPKQEEVEIKTEEPVLEQKIEEPLNEEIISQNTEEIAIEPNESQTSGTVPDWLKGSLDSTETTELVAEPKENEITADNIVLEQPIEEIQETEIDTNLENKSEPLSEEENVNIENLQVPDWLKGSLEEGNKSEEIIEETNTETESKKNNKKEKSSKQNKNDDFDLKLDDNSNLDELTKVEETVIPDWLKGSLEETSKKSDKTKTKTKKQKDDDKKVDDAIKNGNELWQDGMQVPDWLDGNITGDDNSNKK
nr:PKD domain-containing protein [Candidatus Gracilibacteria bacterium]